MELPGNPAELLRSMTVERDANVVRITFPDDGTAEAMAKQFRLTADVMAFFLEMPGPGEAVDP